MRELRRQVGSGGSNRLQALSESMGELSLLQDLRSVAVSGVLGALFGEQRAERLAGKLLQATGRMEGVRHG